MFSVLATRPPVFTCAPRSKRMPFWLISTNWPPVCVVMTSAWAGLVSVATAAGVYSRERNAPWMTEGELP